MLLLNDEASARRYFFIERPGVGLELSYEYDKDTRESPSSTREDSSMTYTEGLEIATEGWVYHPALMEYSLKLAPEWEQFRQHISPEIIRTTNSYLNGYEAEFDFLKFKPYSLTLFGSRNTFSTRSNFAEKTRVKVDLNSAILDLKYDVLPTTVRYLNQKTEQTGFFDSSEDKDQVDLTVRHYKKFSTTLIDSSYKDTSVRTSDSISETNSFNATFDNMLETEGLALQSILHYEETDSSGTHSRIKSINEFLNITHSPTLRTSYKLRYERNNSFDKNLSEHSRTQIKEARFNLNHMLYENLSTNLNLDSSESQSKSGRNSLHGAGVSWNYIRTIPWGVLNTNVRYHYSYLDSMVRIDSSTTLTVQDEPVTLIDGETVLLENPNVLKESLIVTQRQSSDGFGIEYIKDTDYFLEDFGTFTRIIRKPGSSIANGQQVFVHYIYVPNPAFDYSLLNQFYGINLDLWSFLRLYYRLQLSKQTFEGGTLPSDTELLDDSIHTIGTEVTWRWSKTSFEWEDRFTTSSPTEKWRAEELITIKPRFNVYAQLSASYTKTSFKDSSLTENLTNFTSNIQWILSRRSNLSITGFWTDVSGGSQEFTNSELSLVYEWFYRIWEFNMEYRFINEEDKEIDQTFSSHYFLVKLKRNLF